MRTTTTTPAATPATKSRISKAAIDAATATAVTAKAAGSKGKKASTGKAGNVSGGKNSAAAARLSDAEVELLAQRWEELKMKAKEIYESADTIEAELIRQIGPGGSLVLTDNRTLKVVNNFIDANGAPKVKHFGLCGVKMFEVKLK